MTSIDSFGAAADLQVGSSTYRIYRLDALTRAGVGDVATLPYSLRILLENLLRYEDGKTVTKEDIVAVAAWDPVHRALHEVPPQSGLQSRRDTSGRVQMLWDIPSVQGSRIGIASRGSAGDGPHPAATLPWHTFHLRPEPQVQGSFRPRCGSSAA